MVLVPAAAMGISTNKFLCIRIFASVDLLLFLTTSLSLPQICHFLLEVYRKCVKHTPKIVSRYVGLINYIQSDWHLSKVLHQSSSLIFLSIYDLNES